VIFFLTFFFLLSHSFTTWLFFCSFSTARCSG